MKTHVSVIDTIRRYQGNSKPSSHTTSKGSYDDIEGCGGNVLANHCDKSKGATEAEAQDTKTCKTHIQLGHSDRYDQLVNFKNGGHKHS